MKYRYTLVNDRIQGVIYRAYDITHLCPALIEYNRVQPKQKYMYLEIEYPPLAHRKLHLVKMDLFVPEKDDTVLVEQKKEGFELVKDSESDRIIAEYAQCLGVSVEELVDIIWCIPA